MARSDASILGDFTGRIGNIVVYKLNGKTVMRMRPAGGKKKPTPKQKQSRDDFAHVMKYMQSLNQIINTGFYDVTNGRFTFHSALSANLKAYKEAGKPEGAEWLKLSDGKRDGAEDAHVEPLEGNHFKITWGKPLVEGWRSNADRVYVVAVNSTDKGYHYVQSENAQRKQGEVVLEVLMSEPGDEIYFFIFFQNVSGSLHKKDPRNVSPSQFVGKVVMPG